MVNLGPHTNNLDPFALDRRRAIGNRLIYDNDDVDVWHTAHGTLARPDLNQMH